MRAILKCLALVLAFHCPVAWSQSKAPKAPPPLNVSGKWEASNAGFYGQVRQAGPVIVGRCYTGPTCLIRGAFVGDHVMLTANWGHAGEKCLRGTFVAPNTGKLSPLAGKWYGEPNMPDSLTRVSADAGDAARYPYAEELKQCGDLVTYELSFEVNSAQLRNADAPLLASLADFLKADATAKLTIIGHTDATGATEKNKKPSLDRATSVKARIAELCACDPARLKVEGMGPDQPLESNETPAGRTLNRRVEISLGR